MSAVTINDVYESKRIAFIVLHALLLFAFIVLSINAFIVLHALLLLNVRIPLLIMRSVRCYAALHL